MDDWMGMPKLKLRVHYDVTTKKVDGVRCFDGERLVGEIGLDELKRVYASMEVSDEQAE